MLLLADILNRNEFDAHLLGQLIQILLMAGGLAAIWRSTQRKPPVGEDLTKIAQIVAAITKDLVDVEKRLGRGDGILVELQKNQAVNSESINNIKADVHEIKTQLTTILSRIGNRPR